LEEVVAENLAHIQKRLAEEGDKSIAFFESLTQPDWDQQVYTTGSGWRVRQVLAHFISAERAYQQSIQDVLEGGRGTLEDLDIDRFNETETYQLSLQPVPDLIQALRQSRAETIQIIQDLDEADLVRSANHPWFGEKEVGWFLKLLYRHQTMHLYDVQKSLDTKAPVPHTDRFRAT
jgi:uncharacterized damage-inducible protein DinB